MDSDTSKTGAFWQQIIDEAKKLEYDLGEGGEEATSYYGVRGILLCARTLAAIGNELEAGLMRIAAAAETPVLHVTSDFGIDPKKIERIAALEAGITTDPIQFPSCPACGLQRIAQEYLTVGSRPTIGRGLSDIDDPDPDEKTITVAGMYSGCIACGWSESDPQGGDEK